MKLKKSLCAVIAAATLCALGMTSCANDEKVTAEDGNSTAAVQTDVTKNATEIADKLRSDVAFVDSLNELSPEMVEKLIGVSQDKYVSGKVYIGSGGATAEEIACFEANDESAAADIKAALEARIAAQKKAFENYQPKEMDKLNSPVLIVQGKYVFMCISDDNAKAEEIIG